MHALFQDIRYSLRQLSKVPAFSLTIVVTFALGIGANTAIFSVMNAVLLRTLPVREPNQLFYLSHRHMPNGVGDTGDSMYTYGINVYNRLRADRAVFSDLIAYVPLSFTKTAVRFGDAPEEVSADEVSGNFFTALGTRMAAGQPFAAADEDRHSQLAVISYGYWTRRFSRDPKVIGQPIYVNGVPFTIIGITAPLFYGVESGGSATDLWVPLQNRPEISAWGMPPGGGNTLYGSPNWWNLMLMARLRPGVTQAQALAHTNPVFVQAALETTGKETHANGPKLELRMIPARALCTAVKGYQEPLQVLMGMVALVLVIACVNIVMLLVARNSIREREFSLRMAALPPASRRKRPSCYLWSCAGLALRRRSHPPPRRLVRARSQPCAQRRSAGLHPGRLRSRRCPLRTRPIARRCQYPGRPRAACFFHADHCQPWPRDHRKSADRHADRLLRHAALRFVTAAAYPAQLPKRRSRHEGRQRPRLRRSAGRRAQLRADAGLLQPAHGKAEDSSRSEIRHPRGRTPRHRMVG